MVDINLEVRSVVINGEMYVPWDEFKRVIRELNLNVPMGLTVKESSHSGESDKQ